MDKKTLRLLVFAGIVLIVFFVFIFLVSNSFFKINQSTDNQRQIKGDTGLDLDTNPTLIKEDKESSQVMTLLNVAPYQGENFAFFYSYKNNTFTVYINPQNPEEGNREFDEFLKNNGVDSRSWIYNLNTVSVMPTPEP